MSDIALPDQRPIVFISYAREDTAFVKQLRDRLAQKGLDPRGDWLLVTGSGYEKQLLQDNIRSQALIFVLSPDSIRSKPCLDELKIAVQNKKPVLPVLRRDVPDDADMPARRWQRPRARTTWIWSDVLAPTSWSTTRRKTLPTSSTTTTSS